MSIRIICLELREGGRHVFVFNREKEGKSTEGSLFPGWLKLLSQ